MTIDPARLTEIQLQGAPPMKDPLYNAFAHASDLMTQRENMGTIRRQPVTPQGQGKTIPPESRKVLDDYRDALLGPGVSETARMLAEERIYFLESRLREAERDTARLDELEKLHKQHRVIVITSDRIAVFDGPLSEKHRYAKTFREAADASLPPEIPAVSGGSHESV